LCLGRDKGLGRLGMPGPEPALWYRAAQPGWIDPETARILGDLVDLAVGLAQELTGRPGTTSPFQFPIFAVSSPLE